MKIITIALFCLIGNAVFAQITVGLDNWFNRETNPKTGKLFHYLWDDTENGGFSDLGNLFKNKGAQLKTLEKPDKATLAGIDLYIIVDPDTTTENPKPNYIAPEDIKAISAWVKKGGVLLILGNDKPNCEFTHLNKLAEVFGMHFNPVTLNRVTGTNWDMGGETNLPDHPVFKDVRKIYLKEVSSISLWKKAKPVLLDDNAAYMAETKYGKGFVFAVGDPWIYNEYIDHKYLPESFDNLKATKNLVDYLLQKSN